MKKVIIYLLPLLFCLLITPTSSKSSPITKLRLSHTMPEKSDVGVSLRWWADELKKRSGGEIEVEVYPMSVLVDRVRMIDAIKTGVTEIGLVSIATVPKLFPLTTVMMLPTLNFPYSTKGLVESGKAFRELYNKFPSIKNEYTDLHLLMFLGMDVQNIVTKNEVRMPDDLKSMKIGASGDRGNIVSYCGGVPVGVAPPEAYISLDKGVIDGIFSNWPIIQARKLQEVTSYYLDYQLTSLMLVVMMNQSTWINLSPDIKEIIEGMENDTIMFRAKQHILAGDRGKKLWAKSGKTVTTLTSEEKNLWDQKCQPLIEEWVSKMEAKGFGEARQIFNEAKRLSSDSWN